MFSTKNSNENSFGNAREPFNDPESADTIFRTSDGVHFHIHRIVLFLASPFFRDMFSLPQSSSGTDTKPIIDVTESSTVLDPLLRLCYPVDDPEFTGGDIGSLALMGETLEAALKYELRVATKILKGHLRSSISDHPLYVYAIACRLKLEGEASLAAHRWRNSRPDLVKNGDGIMVAKGSYTEWKNTVFGASYVQTMSDISAGAYYRLIQFVRTGIETPFCTPPKSELASQKDPMPSHTVTVSEDFSFPDYDVSVISSDNVEFRVHKLILRLASSKLLENMTTDESGKQKISLPEDRYTLSQIFAACYPGRDMDVHDLDSSHVLSLLSAVQKYEMPPNIIKAVNTLLTAGIHTHPLRIYLVFARNGCFDHAASIARNALFRKPFSELYIPEMEDFTADLLYQLFEYRHQCISSITRICAKYESKSSGQFDWGNKFQNDLFPGSNSLALSGPVVQRQLVALQEGWQKLYNHCNELQSDYNRLQEDGYGYSYSSRRTSSVSNHSPVAFDLKLLYNESKQCEEEINTEISNLKIKHP